MKNNNIIGGILVLAVLLCVGLGCESKYSFTYKGNEIEYKNVTGDEAQQLIDYLIKEEFFDGPKKSLKLDKSGSTYQFRVVIIKPEWQTDPTTIKSAKSMAKELSNIVFNDEPVEIHICNENFQTITVVKP